LRRFIYGEDPASQNDFHRITIHELPEITMDDETPMPLLLDIYAIRNTSFDKILDFHTDVLFKKWTPFYMVFDYTNERIFTNMMIRNFGEGRVEKVNFTAGTSGIKSQLVSYFLTSRLVSHRTLATRTLDSWNPHESLALSAKYPII